MKKFEKISYGLGIVPESVSVTIVSLCLLFFCTDVMRLDSDIVGLIILAVNLFDIVTDLFIMNFIDKHPTKFGVYRLWVLNAIPMSICFLLIFLNPSFLNTDLKKYLWIAILYLLLVPCFETGYLCPYITLRSRLTNNQKEQTGICSIVSAVENLAQLLTIVLVTFLVLNQSFDILNWRIFIIIVVAIMIISTLISFIFTKEHVVVQEERASFKKAFKLLLKNKSLLKLIGILGIVYIPWMAYSSLLTYFCTYNLGHEEWFSYIAIFSLFVCFIMSFVIYPLVSKIGKKALIDICCIALLVSSVMFVFVNSLWSILIFCVLKDFGQIGIYICTFAYVPEIDENFIKESHIKNTGLMTGMVTSLTKIGSSIGTYLASVALSLGNYDSLIEVQTDLTLNWIRYSIFALYLLSTVVILILNRKGIISTHKENSST